MDYLKRIISKQEILSLTRFWIFFFLLSVLRTTWTGTGRNTQYNEWLKTYDGEFNQLKYTEVAFRGNRKANSGKEKLASADLGGEAHGFLGNFYSSVGFDKVQGLNQNNLLLQSAPGNLTDGDARFRASGLSLEFSKRFFRINDYDIHLGISYRNSEDHITRSISGNNSLLQMPGGELIHSYSGNQENDFFNIDMTVKRQMFANSRYSIIGLGGIRFSDLNIKVNQEGTNPNPNNLNLAVVKATRDYHFSNEGVGIFLGFKAQTPITRGVHFAIGAKQTILPSRGSAQLSRMEVNSGGQNLSETTNDRKSSTIPITELSAELNFFWDHATRLNLGYAYSHWNFYEIQGFARDNFQDVTLSGPRFSLNYHF